jgi:hypothetical protein
MKRGFQRFIPIIFVLVIIALIIAAAVSVVRIFTSGGGEPTTSTTDTSSQALLSTTADRKVRMTVRGQITGDETFRSYQITVAPGFRTFTRSQGYQGSPLVNKTYDNNIKAYDEFVHALSQANLPKGAQLTGNADDTRGICAAGVLYEFEIINDSSVIKRLWTTTCPANKGSLAGDVGQLQQLFLAQIPDAGDYIGKD